jgi:hypothetical protein
MALTTTLTDEELALRASGGDKDAFAALYERHFRGVYDPVVRWCANKRPPDAVQNLLNACEPAETDGHREYQGLALHHSAKHRDQRAKAW